MSRRKVPVPADVRAALADVRRARAAAARPAGGEVARVAWESAQGTCVFCGAEGPGARAAGVLVCTQTLAEMIALPAAPEGPEVEELLSVLDRWMAPREGEPAVEPWPVSGEHCTACGRAADDLAQLFAADGAALCLDCARRAAEGRVDAASRDAFAAAEAEAALAELENLERIRAEVKNDPAIRGNATAVLSLLRILGLSEPRTRARLVEIVRALDGT